MGAFEMRYLTPEEESKNRAPLCAARRPRTSARCEVPAHACLPGVDDHVGRDTCGRWHSWPHKVAR